MSYDYEAARAASAALYPDPVFTLEDDHAVDVRNFFYTGCPCGSLIQTPDGREWTVVYHNLDGYGVVEGDHPEFIGAADDALPPHTHLLRAPNDVHDRPCLGEIVRVLRKAPKP